MGDNKETVNIGYVCNEQLSSKEPLQQKCQYLHQTLYKVKILVSVLFKNLLRKDSGATICGITIYASILR